MLILLGLFLADISPEELFNMFFGGGFPSCKYPYINFIKHENITSNIVIAITIMLKSKSVYVIDIQCIVYCTKIKSNDFFYSKCVHTPHTQNATASTSSSTGKRVQRCKCSVNETDISKVNVHVFHVDHLSLSQYSLISNYLENLNHVKNVRDRDIYRYIYIHTQSGNDFNFLCISQKENKHGKYLKISVTATNL